MWPVINLSALIGLNILSSLNAVISNNERNRKLFFFRASCFGYFGIIIVKGACPLLSATPSFSVLDKKYKKSNATSKTVLNHIVQGKMKKKLH